MTEQPDLFGDPNRFTAEEITGPNAHLFRAGALLSHRDDPPASIDAAIRAAPNAAAQRDLIEGKLLQARERGHIAEEIDLLFDWHTPSGSPAGRRLSELIRQVPARVVRLAESRETSTGGFAHVHVLAAFVNGRETLTPPRERKAYPQCE